MLKIRAIKHLYIQDLLNKYSGKVFKISKTQVTEVMHLIFPKIFDENIRLFQRVFEENKLTGDIYYATKANKSNAFLEIAAQNGIGADISSIYELRNALARGIAGKNIISSGPCKSDEFLLLSIMHKTRISIDSIGELKAIIKLQKNVNNKGKTKILIRINDVCDTASRFGIPFSELEEVYGFIRDNRDIIEFKGFSFHMDNYLIEKRCLAVLKILNEIKRTRNYGFYCDEIDIGGGFTVNYVQKDEWTNFEDNIDKIQYYNGKKIRSFYPYYSEYPKDKFFEQILLYKYGKERILDILKKEKIRLLIEPGRALLDQAGITIFRISGVKINAYGENIITVDGNMNHLSEQWFNTDFVPEPLILKKNRNFRNCNFIASVGGNTCMESDMLSWRKISFDCVPEKGDMLVYMNTAAYQMDSNESEFHLYPLPQKIVLYNCEEGKFDWMMDKYFSIMEVLKNDL